MARNAARLATLLVLGGVVATVAAAPALARSASESEAITLGSAADRGAAMLQAGGRTFGTEPTGGAYGAGIVFAVGPDGSRTILHSFAGGATDGATPLGGLVDIKGTLYGTTAGGGASGEGTVFAIAPDGTERLLYSFGATARDGAHPQSTLIALHGVLYGTTPFGGEHGRGTVFSITTHGHETVLHAFGGPAHDGATPVAGLTLAGGRLLGTTQDGGASGSGSAFAITVAGGEKVTFSLQPYAPRPHIGLSSGPDLSASAAVSQAVPREFANRP